MVTAHHGKFLTSFQGPSYILDSETLCIDLHGDRINKTNFTIDI